MATEVGELALAVAGLAFEFGDAGGRGGVQLGELSGSLAGGVPVVLRYIRAVDRWRDNAMRGVGL